MSTAKIATQFPKNELIRIDSNRLNHLQKEYSEKGFEMDKSEKAEMFKLIDMSRHNDEVMFSRSEKEMGLIFKVFLPGFLAGMIGIFVYFSATSSNGYLYKYVNPITKTTVAEVEVTKKVADRNTGWFCDKKAGIIYMDGVAVWKNGCTH